MKPTEPQGAPGRGHGWLALCAGGLLGVLACDGPPDAVAPDAAFVPAPTSGREPQQPAQSQQGEPVRRRLAEPPADREPESVLGADPWTIQEAEVSPYLNSPGQSFYMDAQDAVGRGDLEEAIRLLRNAVALDPEHGDAWAMLWDTVRDGPDRAAAAEACAGYHEHGVLAEQERAQLALTCAVAHHEAGRLPEAEALARTALAAANGRLEPLITLTGILLVQEGRAEEVVELLEGRVRRVGGRLEASALNHLAAGYYQLDRLPEAIETYRQASENDPTRSDILINLAGALARAQQVEEARAVLTGVLEREPQNAEARARLEALGQ